jgi:DNA polymerase III subunit beta
MAKRSVGNKAMPAPASKITLSQDVVRRELDLAASVITGKSTIPVLDNVLLVAKKSKLWMRTTNLDFEFYTFCEVEGDAEFSVGVNTKKLREIVRLLPEEQFDLYTDQSRVRIECGRLHYKLPAVSPENFPEAHQKPDNSITLPANFKDLINSVLFSTSKEESRFALNGVKLEVRKNGILRLVSTDGHRLSLVETECEAGCELGFVLPSHSLSMLAKLLEEESCTMLYGETIVRFTVGNRILSSRTWLASIRKSCKTP